MAIILQIPNINQLLQIKTLVVLLFQEINIKLHYVSIHIVKDAG